MAMAEMSRSVSGGGRFTAWSLAMVPATLLGAGLGYAVGTAFMARLGVPEGQVLSSAGIVGWLAATVVLAVMAAAPVAGVAFGVAAVRRGGGQVAAVAAWVNGLIVIVLVAQTLMGLLGA